MEKHGHRRRGGAANSKPPIFGSPAERFRLIAFVLLLVAILFGGGASREDVLSLLYLRPLEIAFIAVMLVSPGPLNLSPYRIPLILLGAMAVVIAIQLIPLPPDLWLSLPGRERYAEAAAAAGFPQPWRPLSLTPFLTLDSLIALLTPLAVLIGMAGLREDQQRYLLPLLIAAAGLSAMLGILQLTGGGDSPFFLYTITHEGSAVGFFSNRNHQAALLAMAFPMLRIWTLMPARDRQYRRFRFWMAVAVALMLVPMILVTGSRAGMALTAVGLVAAGFIVNPARGRERQARWRLVTALSLLLVPLLIAVAVISMGRAVAIERMVAFLGDVGSEQRVRALPVVLKMTREFFPVGSGFGSFDRLYRGYELDADLAPLYFNRAHNDLLELTLTGGLPAVLVLLVFLIWFGRQAYRAFRRPHNDAEPHLFARLGAVMIVMMFLASLVDYPLRTPLMTAVFAIACGWLLQRRDPVRRPHSGTRP